jgi:ribosome-binding factor A
MPSSQIRSFVKKSDDVESGAELLSKNVDKIAASSTGSSRGKLSKALEKEKTVEISPSTQGYLDSIGEDICDVLNEALSSKEFFKLFKGATDAGKLVEIAEVQPNQDCSHVTAYWASDIVTGFVREVESTLGPEEAKKAFGRTTTYITKKLQKREPQFRSFLIKKMHFKRVPRIFFRVNENEFQDKTSSSDPRQDLLLRNER